MTHPSLAALVRQPAFWLGLALAGALAATALLLAELPAVAARGISALPAAIVLGMLVGNTVFPAIAPRTAAGVDYARTVLLRLGIVLYGFRITFQDVAAVGVEGVLIAAIVVGAVFGLAVLIGRMLGVDRATAMLIGAGSAICGAAAVLAAEPIVRAQAAKVSVAVATVVVFGTLGMFLYPWLYPYLGMGEHAYGVYVGSTVHEVAQVVVAGRAVGGDAEAAAVIEKMLRVMMLAPFLLLLAWGLRARGAHAPGSHAPIPVPWFAIAFIAMAGVNSLAVVPAAVVDGVLALDTLLLAMAMAALGLRTHVHAVRSAGARPLLLAALLFVILLVGGYALNRAVLALLGG